MNRDQISQIVRQVLKGSGDIANPVAAPRPTGARHSRNTIPFPRSSRAVVLTENGRIEINIRQQVLKVAIVQGR